MRKLSLSLTLVLALAAVAAASTTPQSSAKSTNPAAKKAASSSSKAAMKPAAAKQHTLTGCLSGPSPDGAYLLTNHYWKKGVEVGGLDQLKSHVGHEVRLTGMWVGTPGQIGLKEVSQENGKAGMASPEHLFKVSNLAHIANTCTMPAKAPHKPAAKAGTKKS